MTLDNINDYEPKKKYSKNLPSNYKENYLLNLFKQSNTLSYNQISVQLYGDVYITRESIQRIVRSLRKKGYKIKTIPGYGFEYDNPELIEKEGK